jgi:2-polyprenyl-6-methoxyphenol hydroxylase-like FAD-dependent oxidoreductase
VFASEPLTYDRNNTEQQKQIVCDAYRDGGWRLPELLADLHAASEFYLDSISKVEMRQYAKGRIVLLGDSAYGNTLGGFGSGLAIVGAYVLAGELHQANGDHEVAFRRYEEEFRDYAKVARKGSAGPFLAPGTKMGMRMRNQMFKSTFLLRAMLKMTAKFANSIDLKDY